MRKIIRIISVLLCMMLMAGCGKIYFTTGLSKDEIMKIDGNTCTLSEAMIYLSAEKSVYEDSFGEDMWDETIGDQTVEEYIKDVVKDKIAKIECINLLSDQKGIKLTEEEENAVTMAADEYYNGLLDREIEEMNITADMVEQVYYKYALAEKTYISLTENLESQVSDSDAKVIEVQSVFMTSKENIDDFAERVNNGEDFYSLAVELTEDDTVEYIIKKGETLQEYEDAAYSLSTGEMSDVIETERGYYIIYCVNEYLMNETTANKESLLEEEKEAAFEEIYNPFVNKLGNQFNNSVWKKIDLKTVPALAESDFYASYEEYFE